MDQSQSSALEYQKKLRLAESIQTGQAKEIYDDENHGKVWYDQNQKIMGETDLRGVIVGNVLEGYEVDSEGQSGNAEAVIPRLNDIFIPVKDAQNIPHMVC